MAIISKIRIDNHDYDIISANSPTKDEFTELAATVASIGITTDEMTEAMSKLAQLMREMECTNARIDWLEDRISQLGPAPDAKAENPKQKSDLEIFSRIEPSTEFLILGDVGWSEEITNIGTRNMFLN